MDEQNAQTQEVFALGPDEEEEEEEEDKVSLQSSHSGGNRRPPPPQRWVRAARHLSGSGAPNSLPSHWTSSSLYPVEGFNFYTRTTC